MKLTGKTIRSSGILRPIHPSRDWTVVLALATVLALALAGYQGYRFVTLLETPPSELSGTEERASFTETLESARALLTESDLRKERAESAAPAVDPSR